MKYMHVDTGSVATKAIWLESHPEEELEERGLTSEEAFAEDCGRTLVRVSKDRNGDYVEVK